MLKCFSRAVLLLRLFLFSLRPPGVGEVFAVCMLYVSKCFDHFSLGYEVLYVVIFVIELLLVFFCVVYVSALLLVVGVMWMIVLFGVVYVACLPGRTLANCCDPKAVHCCLPAGRYWLCWVG